LPPAEELSPGELKVLRYSDNLSGRDRRRTVRLAEHRQHALRSIYAKLQVRDRSSAVRRARELRLLPRPHTLAPVVTGSR